ncbi:MAG: class I SAM-dependent methyltransferase [Actinomycetota bacterium]|nr:class I SAM-dependent methyltransferase [Actinomycetota bacterium]
MDPRFFRRFRWISKSKRVRRAGHSIGAYPRYILFDPEVDNFTYELANDSELARWVAVVSNSAFSQADALIKEPLHDYELRDRLRKATAKHPLWSKPLPPFGRRRGWYALVRALAPALVFETGVHDGLGSLLLLRALERNREQGHPGRLISIDVNPSSGWLVGAHPQWELHVGPSRTLLPRLLASVDEVGLFIHDSLHTYANEKFELSITADHLADKGVLVTDNAHVTGALTELCEQRAYQFCQFRERPVDHFYGGGAMAAGFG